MKTKTILLLALCLFALTACHHGHRAVPDDKPIDCSVNPDEVFGTHYGPQDFQIHNILDPFCAEWGIYLTWLQILPDGHVSQDGKYVTVSDTALFAPFLDSLTYKLGPSAANYTFSWLPIEDYEEPLYRFLAVNNEPLIDGTSVVESSAVISSYTQEPVLNFVFGMTPNGGNSPQKGMTLNGGNSPQKGMTPNGGNSAQKGMTPNGGNSPQKEMTPNGGNSPQKEMTPNSGNSPQKGMTPNGGNSPQKDTIAQRWYLITNENTGRDLAITLGRRILSAPTVMCAIEGGKCSVSGLTESEACATAAILSGKK